MLDWIPELKIGRVELDEFRESLARGCQPYYWELFSTPLGDLFAEAYRLSRAALEESAQYYSKSGSNKKFDKLRATAAKHERQAQRILTQATVRAYLRVKGSLGFRRRSSWGVFEDTYFEAGELLWDCFREEDPALHAALSGNGRFTNLLRRYPEAKQKWQRLVDRMSGEKGQARDGSYTWRQQRLSDKLSKAADERFAIEEELESIYDEAICHINRDEKAAFSLANAEYHKAFLAREGARVEAVEKELLAVADQCKQAEAKVLSEGASAAAERSTTVDSEQQSKHNDLGCLSSASEDEIAQVRADIDRLEGELAEVKRWRESDDQSLGSLLDRLRDI